MVLPVAAPKATAPGREGMAEDASLDDFLDDDDGNPADGTATSAGQGEPSGEEAASRAAGDRGDGEASVDDGEERSASLDGTAGTGDSEGRPDGTVGSTAAEPAASTYAWSPGGAECPECGATVERRWRGDGDLVCPACTDW